MRNELYDSATIRIASILYDELDPFPERRVLIQTSAPVLSETLLRTMARQLVHEIAYESEVDSDTVGYHIEARLIRNFTDFDEREH